MNLKYLLLQDIFVSHFKINFVCAALISLEVIFSRNGDTGVGIFFFIQIIPFF